MKGIEKTNDKDAKVLLQPLDVHLCAMEYLYNLFIREGLVQEMQMTTHF
jgi:hypothetical protein